MGLVSDLRGFGGLRVSATVGHGLPADFARFLIPVGVGLTAFGVANTSIHRLMELGPISPKNQHVTPISR